MSQYLSNATYRRQKSALTRALNSKDGAKIRATVRKTVAEWSQSGSVWPDDWHRWNRAYADTFRWNDPANVDIDSYEFLSSLPTIETEGL